MCFFGRLVFFSLIVVSTTGCASVVHPLCEKVARASYSDAGDHVDNPVNRYIVDQANRRGIEIRKLSPFVAEFRGPRSQIRGFSKTYPFMLCAFDPANVIDDRSTFISCMSHAPEWIEIVQRGNPRDLMQDRTFYADNCLVN